MENIDQSHFVNRLKTGIDTKIVLFAHNSLWNRLQYFEQRYENLKIDVFGDRTVYMGMNKEYVLDDCDFILFYSTSYFDENELIKLKDIAFRISGDNKKRVSIGYLYMIPLEERKYKDISEEIKIVSFNNGNLYEETTYNFPETTILELTEMVAVIHEELDNQKTYQYNRK